MDLVAFRSTLGAGAPPTDDLALQALWREARGEWDAAHDLTNREGGQDGAWVHAYLHRVEGDLSNADFWYARAGRARPECGTDEEWTSIATELLERGG
jgi:hypothetical protein